MAYGTPCATCACVVYTLRDKSWYIFAHATSLRQRRQAVGAALYVGLYVDVRPLFVSWPTSVEHGNSTFTLGLLSTPSRDPYRVDLGLLLQ